MAVLEKNGVYKNADGDDLVFYFTASPTMYQKIEFTKFVVDTIVGESYCAVAKDLFFDFYMIKVFTDVDVSHILKDEIEFEEQIGLIEDIVYNTEIANIVKANMGLNIVDELYDAVEHDIEYRTGIHRNPIANSFAKLLDTIEHKVSDVDLDKLMNIADAMSGISSESLADKIVEAYAKSDIFDKI